MSLYRKLADDLREQIVSGDFPPGSELPSEAQLGRQFNVGRDTVRRAYDVLTHEGLIETSQGRGRRVRSHEVFVLDASRHENLQFSEEESGDSYSNEVRHAGRRPHQEFRVELQPAPATIASRLGVQTGETTVLRFCLRYVDTVPWSTQATHYPMWLADGTRIAEPHDIEEGTTRYLAELGFDQVGYHDELSCRMPTPDEARDLEVGPGIPVLVWVRTGYTADRAVRCTTTIFRGDLNRLTYDIGDLQARQARDDPR